MGGTTVKDEQCSQLCGGASNTYTLRMTAKVRARDPIALGLAQICTFMSRSNNLVAERAPSSSCSPQRRHRRASLLCVESRLSEALEPSYRLACAELFQAC